MTKAMISAGARLAAIALATTGAITLTACEEHPYPSAAPGEATAAPRPDDATLAGAPAGPGGGYQVSPTTRSPTVYPPGGAPYPPQGYAQDGPPPRGPYGPPAHSYPPGYGGGYAATAPPEIITMAPIPNPPERTYRYGSGRSDHHHAHYYSRRAYSQPAHEMGRPHHLHHRRRFIYGAVHPATARAPQAYRPAAAPASVHRRMAQPTTGHPQARAIAPAAQPQLSRPQLSQSQLTQPQALDHYRHHHHAVAPTTNTTSTTRTVTSTNTVAADNGTEADRYQALERDLRDQFAQSGRLSAPSHTDVGQTALVSLTLPADFAQTVRTEAAKQNLSQQAMTMNLTAGLSGEGYTIVPAEAQTLPLAMDAPTSFTWRVTPNGASRGALKASVRAVMGDGHEVVLGDKTAGSGSATGRIVGIGLLALIALVLLGWAAQRRRPVLTGATKPRASHTNGVA